MNSEILISRSPQMLHKAVIINGFPGCGKTMLSPIISAFDRVEIMQYAPVIEQMCELWGLDSIDEDVAKSMIKMNADMLIYNITMGRTSNCRPSDLSSIFKHKPLTHIRRMLAPGDLSVLDVVRKNKPILHLTTHALLPYAELLLNTFGDKLVFIEVVRHPLYTIIQQEGNLSRVSEVGDPRDQHIRYTFHQKEYQFNWRGMEDMYNIGNSYERAIYTIDQYYSDIFSNNRASLTIYFEKFVKSPENYLNNISSLLGSDIAKNVRKEMKRQKVPRTMLADGPSLDIYSRCGWTPSKFYSEEEELNARREIVKKNVSTDALALLDSICNKYEKLNMH